MVESITNGGSNELRESYGERVNLRCTYFGQGRHATIPHPNMGSQGAKINQDIIFVTVYSGIARGAAHPDWMLPAAYAQE